MSIALFIRLGIGLVAMLYIIAVNYRKPKIVRQGLKSNLKNDFTAFKKSVKQISIEEVLNLLGHKLPKPTDKQINDDTPIVM